MIDYYKLLNANMDTSPEELKEKYHRRLRKYHPDKTTDTYAKKKLALIKEAYNTLKDPYTKGKYDAEYDRIFNNESLENFIGVFDDLTIMPKIKLPKKIPKLSKLQASKKSYSMNSFSSSTVVGKDGKFYTKRSFTTNNNGKKKNFYQEFTTDKNGKINIIKEIGTGQSKFKSLKDIED